MTTKEYENEFHYDGHRGNLLPAQREIRQIGDEPDGKAARMYLHGRCDSLILVIVLVLSVTTPVPAQERPIPASYDLKVTIEPTLGTISVRGRIEVPRRNPGSSTVKFGLHETFAIKQLSVEGHPATFSFQPGEPTAVNPATKNVAVKLPSGTPADKIHLEIQYGGRLKGIPEFGTFPDQKQSLDDQINSRLVELANYSSWYPQFFVFGYPLRVALEVSFPEGWIAVCSGKKLDDRVKDGRSSTRWSSPTDTDILIAASPHYKQKSLYESGGQIEIYYTQLPEEFVERDGRQIADVIKLFTDRLGETTIPSGTIKHVFSPKRKGQGRAGIARPGMIITSEGLVLEGLAKDPESSLFQDIAHEIAHFWWNFGAGQGDWINEAFAEYFSALAVEKSLSEDQFQRVLEEYRAAVRRLPADAPSLAKAPFDGSSFVIRYYKGSLMLHHLRGVLGDDRFFEDVRDFFQTYKGESIGTVEFRSFWKERLGDRKDSLDVWLDSAGGLRELEQRQVVNRDSQSVNTIPVSVRARISGEMVDAEPVLTWRCGCDECSFDRALTDS